MANESKAARPTRAERKAAEGGSSNTLKVLGAIIAIFAVIFIVGLLLYNASTGNKPEVAEGSQQVSNERGVDSQPLFPEGIHSWQEWEAKANARDREALLKIAGVTPEQSKKWAAEEAAMGKDFQEEVKPGTTIANSGRKGKNGWYKVPTYTVKPGDTLFLTTDKGVIAVKVSCGNPVAPCTPKVAEKEPKPKPKKEEPCPTRNSDPSGKYTPHHPGTDTYYNPKAPANPEAPDYDRGNAEEVEENRGSGESSTGSPGTGSGGTTPGGTTGEVGGGTKKDNTGPTSPPDTTTKEDVYTNPPPPN